MRAAFGLVGLLVGIGVLVFFLGKKGGGLDYVKTVTDTGQKAQDELRPLTGAGVRDFKESVTLEASTAGGKTVALLVMDVKVGGPAEVFYGLKRDDAITRVAELTVKDQNMGADDGADFLAEAYQRKQPIIVVRNDKEITLPLPIPQAAGPAKPVDDRGALQRQLDNVTSAGQKPPGGD